MNLREIWAEGRPTFGAWLSLPSVEVAETAAGIGFDHVCIDTQHGTIDYPATVGMVQAILLGGSRPIARVPWNEPGILGKILDVGVEGVVVPMVNSAAEAEAVVRGTRYPPLGERSYGPVMAGLRTDAYHETANDRVAVIPMIETARALRNLDEILAVPGIDAVYVGPADLSLSLGLPPRNNDGESAFDAALAAVVTACRKAGVVPGIHSTGDLAARRVEQGFQMISVSSDTTAMRIGMSADLATARNV